MPKGVKYFPMKRLFWSWTVFKWWPSVCCEEGTLSHEHSACQKPLSGLTVVLDRHTGVLQTGGQDCRIISGPFSIDYKNTLRNRASTWGLILSHGTSVTRGWSTPHFGVLETARPSLSGDSCLDTAITEILCSPKEQPVYQCNDTSAQPPPAVFAFQGELCFLVRGADEGYVPSLYQQQSWDLPGTSQLILTNTPSQVQVLNNQEQSMPLCGITEAKWTHDCRVGWGGEELLSLPGGWDSLWGGPELWGTLAGKSVAWESCGIGFSLLSIQHGTLV